MVLGVLKFNTMSLSLRPSMVSESEAEDDPSSHVEVPQKLPSRGNMVSQQSSIRLNELGPRMTLQVVSRIYSVPQLSNDCVIE